MGQYQLASAVMEAPDNPLYRSYMARKKAPFGSLLKRELSGNFIAKWRGYRDNLTQERLAERVAEILGTSFTAATLSRIENRKSPYSTRQLDALAEALRCEPADLISRDPTDPEAPPWSIWDRLGPEQRRQAIRVLRALADEAA